MIRYATEKYGEERVAQIITYGTIKAKAAIKDAARVLGYPFALGDRITKAMPPRGDGQGHPAGRHLRPEPPALPGGGRVPHAVRVRPGRPEGRRHRQGARGPQAAVGRARGRRDPVPRAAGRRAADPEARAGRRDHHPVGHGRLRVHRPAQDGLPRPAQPHRHRRLPREHQGQPRHRPGAGGRCRSTTRPTYELLARGDTLGVFQLDGGPMRVAAALDGAGQLRGHLRRAARSTGPARWAPTRTTTTPTARTSASRSCRSTPSWPSRSPRSSATPTA